MLLLLWACEDPVVVIVEDTEAPSPPEPLCEEPASEVLYTDLATSWGLVDTTDEDLDRMEENPAAAFDVDADGDDDLVLGVRGRGVLLQRNLGDRLGEAEILDPQDAVTLAVADVEGDGDLDLVSAGRQNRAVVLRNDGLGTFVAEATPLVPGGPTTYRDATFGDMDGDGDLDLFLIATATDTRVKDGWNRLLENDGTGTFTDVSDRLPDSGRTGLAWSGLFFDQDGDGDQDLYYVTAEQTQFGGSRLLRNDGSSFTDITSTCACESTHNSMGVSPGDLDRDGTLDLLITSTGRAVLLQGQADGSYVDQAVAWGTGLVADERAMSWSAQLQDFDNDGWLDIYASTGRLGPNGAPGQPADQPDAMLWGGQGAFLDASAAGAVGTGDGRGTATVDLDGDGFPEILSLNLGTPSHLYRSPCTAAEWLVVELRQEGPNPFGEGALLRLELQDGTVLLRRLSSETGWGGAAHPRAWFGMGDQRALRLSVLWPDGGESALESGLRGRITLAR